MKRKELIQAWRSTIADTHKSWVVFENGTCVILMNPETDLVKQATTLLRDWAQPYTGSPSGDFGTITLTNGLGWAATCYHNDILTFVGMDEVEQDAGGLRAGLLGRSKRAKDAKDLRVVHVENNGPPNAQ